MYTRIYYLRFPKETSDQPIVYQLVKQFDVQVNILKADILPQREGIMVLEMKGNRESVKEGLGYLKDIGVHADRLATRISRDEKRCFQCGACTGMCPVGALYLERPSMEVRFDPEKCTGCGVCVTGCPVRAMRVSFPVGEEAALEPA